MLTQEFYAIDDGCLHHGGSLGTSKLEGKIVTCNAHGWKYDVTAGSTVPVPGYGVKSNAVWSSGYGLGIPRLVPSRGLELRCEAQAVVLARRKLVVRRSHEFERHTKPENPADRLPCGSNRLLPGEQTSVSKIARSIP
jgi:hypothetical protein